MLVVDLNVYGLIHVRVTVNDLVGFMLCLLLIIIVVIGVVVFFRFLFPMF